MIMQKHDHITLPWEYGGDVLVCNNIYTYWRGHVYIYTENKCKTRQHIKTEYMYQQQHVIKVNLTRGLCIKMINDYHCSKISCFAVTLSYNLHVYRHDIYVWKI